MRPIGFSTGALALGDFRAALRMLAETETKAVELSALRDHELGPLMESLTRLDLSNFSYVSVHVPSKFKSLTETEVAAGLRRCIDLKMAVVIHPDVIRNPACWMPFGSLLCIENMDKRKHTGRTAAELKPFFATFQDATFCLDIAHARQIDSTMNEARQMLRRFGHRLRQIHISEIDGEGHHRRLSAATILAGQSLNSLIGNHVPVIIESMIPAKDMNAEIEAVKRALADPGRDAATWEHSDWGELA
jgi:hypothetical protein